MKNKLLFCVATFTPLALGVLTSLAAKPDAYSVINKPLYSPPAIVFPIVWTILYLLMGYGLYLVLKDHYNNKTIKIFATQLLLNLSWSFIFFVFKNYYLAILCLIGIIAFVILMIFDFKKYNKTAYLLQIPYLIWLFIALYLNIGVAVLN